MRYFCCADFNRDDLIDDRDLADFLANWTVREGPLAPYLDINRDAWLTEDDVMLFFASFDEDCNPDAQASTRLIVC